LDRVTGEPLYDFRLAKTEGKTLPGDITSPYQPLPELPQPFARQAYTMDDAPKQDPARAFVLPTLQRANMGPFPSLEEAKPTVMFNIHGGAEWTGAAADARGFLYVTSNEIPWAITTFRDDDPEPAKPPTPGEQTYQQLCAACHGADRRGVGHAPPLRGARHRIDEEAIRALLKSGRSTMPPMPFLTEEQLRPLIDFVLCKDRGANPQAAKGSGSWTFAGFKKLLDEAAYPACTLGQPRLSESEHWPHRVVGSLRRIQRTNRERHSSDRTRKLRRSIGDRLGRGLRNRNARRNAPSLFGHRRSGTLATPAPLHRHRRTRHLRSRWTRVCRRDRNRRG
jgi:mono/diheme cytochrome c family protein